MRRVKKLLFRSSSGPWSWTRGLRWPMPAWGQCTKALEEAREALRLQPENEENYVSVGDSYICLNRLGEAEALLKLAEQRKLEGRNLLYVRYNLAFLKGDAGEMQRLVATSEGKAGRGLSPFLAGAGGGLPRQTREGSGFVPA